ncbi:MAG: 3'(2'),5'-bisphosphate nucleotidase CysQ [candidate division Zixibacteria bacterium]|jgi:myo-inositol-1(or 4)-monophosphatase|nr:3'(2'),5'-bisphosphate nucleotidase CysQ [candidate division Zixibacteria bacterium]
MADRSDIMHRIQQALDAAVAIFERFTPGTIHADDKGGGDPVTEADRAVNNALKELLHRDGEGWLSEETRDNPDRLTHARVWIVDPLDGTREFVKGIPEWCVSIGLVENGRAVAGGICNPATRETIVGSLETGVTYNGLPAQPSQRVTLDGAVVLASRSEIKRGEWERFADAPFEVRPTGSVAYKLGLVAAGRCDTTWTLAPKNEWDVAAGVALVLAAGGFAETPDGAAPTFNNPSTLLPGLIVGPAGLRAEIRRVLSPVLAEMKTARS